MAHLRIQNLSKSFGAVKCLQQVDLEVDDGRLAVIVGPSGCGKTTLMRCIAGLETVTEGSIFIDGERINDKEPKDRDVAMVFQYYALYPHMTVRQNLSLGLEHTTDLSREEINRKVGEIADILHISRLLDRKPGQLSGGESQRVAIGRALVREPKIFLMDEPLSAIDAKLRRELRAEIKKIQKRFGVTTIYVTHDQEEAMAVGDLLVVLREGRIHQVDTPEEVYNHPNDPFVAGFIGKPPMNFFELKVAARGGRFFLENEAFSYEISGGFYRRYLSGLAGDRLIVGVRPSAIRITMPDGAPAAGKCIAAAVTLVENMGSENHIHLALGSKKLIARCESVPEIGDRVCFIFDEDDLHLFDAQSRESLKR